MQSLIHLGKTVKLPICGVVKMREKLRFDGRVLSATVSRMADGWYCAILVDTNDCLSGSLAGGAVGVDLGIKELAVLSNGEVIPSLKPHRLANKRLVRLSRSLSRKQKGNPMTVAPKFGNTMTPAERAARSRWRSNVNSAASRLMTLLYLEPPVGVKLKAADLRLLEAVKKFKLENPDS